MARSEKGGSSAPDPNAALAAFAQQAVAMIDTIAAGRHRAERQPQSFERVTLWVDKERHRVERQPQSFEKVTLWVDKERQTMRDE
ncbi:MAG: hypothetical protein ABSE49_19745 [Polyangiaceae bacterium]